LLLELLPIFDNLKSAFSQVPSAERAGPWLVGLTHIKSQFEKFLRENGIEEIKTVDERFNPLEHEAVECAPAETVDQDDIIIKEIKAGYKLHGRVIQPAKVIVNKFDK
jgi:molecular chaperone GrpE